MPEVNNDLRFQAFDPEAEVHRESRCLPHWFQPGVATFITFRTADSMPQHVIEQWHEELRVWLISKGQASLVNSNQLPNLDGLPLRLQAEYRKVRDRGWQTRLDECHGECLLGNPELREIVVDSLLHFQGERYQVDCLVVMPNHVHLIAQFAKEYPLRKQSAGWLRYSARKINEILGRRGPFWQAEPFDHLIRSPSQFQYLRRYVADNPAKAKLRASESSVVQFSEL